MKKLYPDAVAALDGLLADGMLIAAGGFGLCGIPERLLEAIPALLLAKVRFFTPLAWIASSRRSGMPHRPNPPAAISISSWSRPSSAAAAVG